MPNRDESLGNPYQAPLAPAFQHSPASSVDPKLVKNFRRNAVALGVLWILSALVNGGLAATMIAPIMSPRFADAPDDIRLTILTTVAMLAILAVVWLVAGVGAIMKQVWAFYIGLIVCSIGTISLLVQMQFCPLVITLIMLVYSYKCISDANTIRAAEAGSMGAPMAA